MIANHLGMTGRVLKRKPRHWKEGRGERGRDGRRGKGVKRRREDGQNIKARGVTWKRYSEMETQPGEGEADKKKKKGNCVNEY